MTRSEHCPSLGRLNSEDTHRRRYFGGISAALAGSYPPPLLRDLHLRHNGDNRPHPASATGE